jgi:hypothetical protein
LCFPHDALGEKMHLLANYFGGLLKGWALDGPKSRQAQMHGLEAHDELRKINAGPQLPALLE